MTTRNMNRQPVEVVTAKSSPTTTAPKSARVNVPLVPIIIDTRERQPWAFTVEIDNAIATRGTLATGDYSVKGYESKICVERKSLTDWVNTIVNDYDRFRKELKRMESYDRSYIIIECTINDICERKYEVGGVVRKIDPTAIMHMTLGIMDAYPMTQIIFADDRYNGRCICRDILRQFWKAREMAKEAGR